MMVPVSRSIAAVHAAILCGGAGRRRPIFFNRV
jgi:hypothetical protein